MPGTTRDWVGEVANVDGLAVILLDTHAVIWMAQGHRRVRLLDRFPRIYLSPASVLEVEFLIEAGRLRLGQGQSLITLMHDQRWRLDEPRPLELRLFELRRLLELLPLRPDPDLSDEPLLDPLRDRLPDFVPAPLLAIVVSSSRPPSRL